MYKNEIQWTLYKLRNSKIGLIPALSRLWRSTSWFPSKPGRAYGRRRRVQIEFRGVHSKRTRITKSQVNNERSHCGLIRTIRPWRWKLILCYPHRSNKESKSSSNQPIKWSGNKSNSRGEFRFLSRQPGRTRVARPMTMTLSQSAPGWIADVEELAMALGMSAQQNSQEGILVFELMRNKINWDQTKLDDCFA